MRRAQRAAIGADRDVWTKRAFNDALAAVRELITGRLPPINPSLKLERLTECEWGWIISTAIGAWVRVRSQQAASEGWDLERSIHATRLEPDPWLEGAVKATLPMLLESCPDLDWSKPVGEWEKDDVLAFLIAAFGLIRRALAARDAAENPLGAGGANPDVVARQLNAAAGNPLMMVAEIRELGGDNSPPF